MKIAELSSQEVSSQIRRAPGNLYLLLDGARFENIHQFLYSLLESPDYFPVYHKTYYQTAMGVSPCLLRVDERHHAALQWYFDEGATKNMALVMTSPEPLEALGKHCQNFLEVKLPSMEIVLFRYYDPTVFDTLVRAEHHGIKNLLAPLSSVYWQHSQRFFCLNAIAQSEM